jgi:hypothetical protein
MKSNDEICLANPWIQFDLIWLFSKGSIRGFDLRCSFQNIQFVDSICEQKILKGSIRLQIHHLIN